MTLSVSLKHVRRGGGRKTLTERNPERIKPGMDHCKDPELSPGESACSSMHVSGGGQEILSGVGPGAG